LIGNETIIDVCATFKTDRIRSSDILYNLTDKTEDVIWYAKCYCLKPAPCPEFSEILKKYRGF